MKSSAIIMRPGILHLCNEIVLFFSNVFPLRIQQPHFFGEAILQIERFFSKRCCINNVFLNAMKTFLIITFFYLLSKLSQNILFRCFYAFRSPNTKKKVSRKLSSVFPFAVHRTEIDRLTWRNYGSIFRFFF